MWPIEANASQTEHYIVPAVESCTLYVLAQAAAGSDVSLKEWNRPKQIQFKKFNVWLQEPEP